MHRVKRLLGWAAGLVFVMWVGLTPERTATSVVDPAALGDNVLSINATDSGNTAVAFKLQNHLGAGQPGVAVASGKETRASSLFTPDPATQSAIVESYARLPLAFEANRGQTDREVKFLSRGSGYTLLLTSDAAVFSLHPGGSAEKTLRPGESGSWSVINDYLESDYLESAAHRERRNNAVLRMEVVGANPDASASGVDELPGRSSYLVGANPNNWRTNVENYAKVRYENIYPGVDLIYYGNQRQLEYDFVVEPGADPAGIRLKFHGAEKAGIAQEGDLLLAVEGREVRLQKPQIYQEAGGRRKDVEGRYAMTEANTIRFIVADYDRSKPLIIDPILVYSTYLGGNGNDRALDIAVDAMGNAYVTGSTDSPDFPGENPIQSSGGNGDAFVTKLNAGGTALLYSTYLGGSDDDEALGIAVDATGNAYVTGYTFSPDFPVVNPLQPNLGGIMNAFVLKLNASGTALLYSTYLGGSFFDQGRDIAVDSVGGIYVAGGTGSFDFPTLNAIQANYGGNTDVFVTKLNAAGTALLYSTYLGGTGGDASLGIAVDPAGNAYVTGGSVNRGQPTDRFPTVNAIQSTYGGDSEVFVTKLNAAGTALLYSTYLGGSGNEGGRDIAVDSMGNAYVTGSTDSLNFPAVNPIQSTPGGIHAFVTKINGSGTALLYSTYLGGTASDAGDGIAVDSAGNAYVTGGTNSDDFPTVNATQASFGGGPSQVAYMNEAFVTKINASGTALLFSTFLGGTGDEVGSAIAVDSMGDAHVTGSTTGAFPTVNAIQSTYGGGTSKAFVVRISPANTAAPIPAITSVTPDTGRRGQTLANVVIVGHNTHFVQGITQASFDAGITVNSLTVNSPTIATASITVQNDATLGAQTVTVTTGTEAAALINGFTTTPDTVLVSDLVRLDSMSTSTTPPETGGSRPEAPAGIFTILARFTNISDSDICNPFFKISQISEGNELLDVFVQLPSGEVPIQGIGGMVLDHPPVALRAGQSLGFEFEIGLQTRDKFNLFVEMWGSPRIAGGCTST